MKKIHAVTLKKFDQWSKKNSYKENDKKHSRVRKFPTTHNFSNGPSLRTDFTYNTGVKFHTLKLEAWVFIGFIKNISILLSATKTFINWVIEECFCSSFQHYKWIHWLHWFFEVHNSAVHVKRYEILYTKGHIYLFSFPWLTQWS